MDGSGTSWQYLMRWVIMQVSLGAAIRLTVFYCAAMTVCLLHPRLGDFTQAGVR